MLKALRTNYTACKNTSKMKKKNVCRDGNSKNNQEEMLESKKIKINPKYCS